MPLDQRLQLPESECSYVLPDWDQALGAEHAFSRIDETIRMILGFQQPVDSLERMNRQMARTVESFRTSRPRPPAEEEGEIVVVTADNQGIPMRRPADQRPVGSHRKQGEKANQKQMATVGAVYTVDPKVRTAEEVVAALFRDGPAKPSGNEPPVARHKRIWSEWHCRRVRGLWEGGHRVMRIRQPPRHRSADSAEWRDWLRRPCVGTERVFVVTGTFLGR